jgi:hypothetical protein
VDSSRTNTSSPTTSGSLVRALDSSLAPPISVGSTRELSAR